MSAPESRTRHLIAAIVLVLAGAVSGCAHNNPRDPFEPFNRGVFAFNDAIDNAVLRPVAQGYRAVFPQFVRTGVRNFFSNLDDITVFINNVLQLKLPQAASDGGRFLLNSTVGIVGLVDVATHVGLEKHNEDFGQTLGYWGIDSGPYLVLPFWGPSSVRDGIGRVVDWYTDVVWYIDDVSVRNILLGTRVVSNREQLLDSEKVLDAAALDRYTFIRDAFLQRRRNLVFDGNPPPEPEENVEPGKPRSEAAPAQVSILVDQFGNVVLAPAIPPRASMTAPEPAAERSAPPLPAHPPAASGSAPNAEPVSEAPDASRPAEPPALQHQGAANELPRVVRVWLPGASGR